MSFWTPDKVKILRSEWADGASVQIIANMVGSSRNAVIGKAKRLQLPMHTNSAHHPDKARKPRGPQIYKLRGRSGIPRKLRFKTVPLPKPKPFSPDPLNILFDDLEQHHCRYAVNDALPYLFCGHPKEGDSSYCEFHKDLCTGVRRGYAERNVKYFMAKAA